MHVINRFVTRACAVAAAGVALSAAVATAASASGGGGVPVRPGALSPADSVAGRGPANSRYIAGYEAAVPAGSATVASASFIVPTLSCTTTDRAISASVVVPVNNYKTVSVAGVSIGCVNGTAVYFPWLTVNGTETDYTSTHFPAGDPIELITKVSTNRTRVQVTDETTGVTQKIIGPGASASAAFIGDSPWFNSSNKLEHVPDFGKLTFKGGYIDNIALGGWRPQAIQRVNSIGTVQIRTGNFWPGGKAFSTHYEHS